MIKSTASKLAPLTLVIPAYNDETTIKRLVDDADVLLKQVCDDYEIVVCNDGSKDGTLSILQALSQNNPRVRLINHEVNRGFGFTIRELYLCGQKELVFSLPGDYQYAPKELLTMAEGLDDYDLIIGWRVNRNDPPKRKLQSHVYNAMLRLFYGHKQKDVNSIKLFKRRIFDKVQLQSYTPFVDAELCIRAERAGFKIIEIPIEHLPRLSQGASGGKFSVIWETFSDLIKMRTTF
ncbi:MAG: glycosyltransferase family 2 protein [Candidatus Obscuribacterales bacterium]|nr:glycosyltransferase family 2 protein [Candidatus Obscuribacterales bacterium]